MAGVGSLGQHHARIYAALPGATLAGVYELDDGRAKEVCGRLGCVRFGALEELAAACDAVSVVVPTDRHAEVALPLLARGCHLLIEKPSRCWRRRRRGGASCRWGTSSTSIR